MVKIIVVLVCCAALSAWAENCPGPMKERLNVTAYAGRWYPVMEMAWPAPNCSFVDYSEVNKTTLSVSNSSLGASNDYENVQGVASISEENHFSVAMADNYTDNYYVMTTDYGNYTVLVVCDSILNITQRAVVLGRERNLTDELLNEALQGKLNAASLDAVWQSECPNTASALVLPPLGLLLAVLVTWSSL